MDDLFRVSVTAIVINHEGKILITKRTATKKKWPSKWTVPGGGVTKEDFLGTPTTTNCQWYDVLINAVKREVKEETNLDIYDVEFLCDLAIPDTIIISFTAKAKNAREVVLQVEETDEYAWIGEDEIKNYDLIEGLAEELLAAFRSEKPDFKVLP